MVWELKLFSFFNLVTVCHLFRSKILSVSISTTFFANGNKKEMKGESKGEKPQNPSRSTLFERNYKCHRKMRAIHESETAMWVRFMKGNENLFFIVEITCKMNTEMYFVRTPDVPHTHTERKRAKCSTQQQMWIARLMIFKIEQVCATDIDYLALLLSTVRVAFTVVGRANTSTRGQRMNETAQSNY